MDKPILEIKNLTKYYKKTKGIENLSLSLYQGEIFGFIGPNGAGKSTTIRTIMQLIKPTHGEILINGKAISHNDIKLKEIIGYLPSEIHLYNDMSVKQILDYHESFYTKNIHNRRQELVIKLQLDENKIISDLSLGNLKKVGIILALMHEPELIILDEPTSGLDPIMQNIFYNLLKEEQQKGTTILYSTHILSEIDKICQRVGIIKDGELIKIEEVSKLKQKNLTSITLTSKDLPSIIKELNINNYQQLSDYTIHFNNTLSSQELIQHLSHYTIDQLLIEEASLEDMFLHYYS